MLMDLHEDFFYIMRNSLRRWYLVCRSSCLHEGLKSMVLYDFEGLFTLSNPMDDLGSRIDMKEGYIEKNHIVRTLPHLLCAEYVDRLPYPLKLIEIQPGSTHPEVLSLRAHLMQHQDSALQ